MTYLGATTHNSYTFGVRLGDTMEAVGGSFLNNFGVINESKMFTVKKGDKIMLRFDFDTGALTVFYNEELVGKAFDNVPNEIIPALALCDILTDISVTDVKAYKKESPKM